jgi:hypothetical protein
VAQRRGETVKVTAQFPASSGAQCVIASINYHSGIKMTDPTLRIRSAARRSLIAPKYFRWLMIVFIIAGLFSAFRLGLYRGFEHTIGAESYGRLGFATCAAITDLARHGPGGYVCNQVVETVLAYAGLTGDEQALAALSTKYPDNLRDQTLIDNAIKKAVSFPITPAHQQFRGAGLDDIGMVDFVKLAVHSFRLQSHLALPHVLYTFQRLSVDFLQCV